MHPENPFKIVDGKAYGPGVLDMKGGILIALTTVKALNRIGYDERPIKFCFSGDEEINHTGSQGALRRWRRRRRAACAPSIWRRA